jgi:hypothetical protein
MLQYIQIQRGRIMPKDIQFVDQGSNGASSQKSSKIIVNEREEFFAALERAEGLVKGESSRAKVLIYVAAIERSLQEILRNVLVPSNQKEDVLLGKVASTFEAQIDMAYRIGVVSHNMCRDLHILRELRDDCYGRIENFSFEHGAIKSSVDMLERTVGKQVFIGLPVLRRDAEDKFSFLARTFLVTLENTKEKVGRFNEAKQEKLYRES